MERKAAVSVIMAGIFWGSMTIFVKELSAAGFASLQIAFMRLAVAAPLFSAVTLIRDRKSMKIHLKDLWMFIGTGIISLTLFTFSYFYTLVNSQASIAVILLYTSPAFVMLMSAVLFHEKITKRKLLALVMTLAGCVLVAGFIGSGTRIAPVILLFGILSGFFYALYTIFGRFALEKYDTSGVTAWTFIFGMLGTMTMGQPAECVRIMAADPAIIPVVIGLGIFGTVLPYFLYTWGLKRMENGKAAILVAVEPLVGALLGIFMYGEPHDPAKVCGIVLILSAIVLLNLEDKK